MIPTGPFNFEAGKSKGRMPILHLNPYSWSKVMKQYNVGDH